MLETLIGAIMVASLIVYALMGGADYGGGVWDLLASGSRAKRQRQAIAVQYQPDLQDDFRRRAIWAQTALIPLAIIVFATSKYGAPLMFHGLTNWWAPVLLGWTGLSAIAAALALWSRRFYLARIAAAAQVTFILLGWALAQFPHLVTPDVTIQNAAAPESTLRLLLLALGAGAVVLLPSLYYLFQIFRGQEQR
jgi:cytochrome d ubiquinol oxidase subunit II